MRSSELRVLCRKQKLEVTLQGRPRPSSTMQWRSVWFDANPLLAKRHPKSDCWRLRRRAGCVATSRWVRRDGALGVAPGGKAVMGPAWPCATSAGSTRSPPFSATLAADSGSFRIATEAQVAQRAQAAATALRAAQRVGPRCTSATVACGFPVAEDVVAPLWQAREKRDSAYVAQRGWSCRELRGSDACRSSSMVGLFSILGLSYSYGLAVLRNLQYQVLRVHGEARSGVGDVRAGPSDKGPDLDFRLFEVQHLPAR